jgi:endonuclease/exonuclease/phosphatase family metal-dependent hydrolase
LCLWQRKHNEAMIYRFERWRRELRRWVSRSEWLRFILRRPTFKNTACEPGILLIQIDGLAFRQLERAMAEGRMPFLRRLMAREHYKLMPFYSGLPSTTPAVQGELYYDVRCAVPAFGFLDRATDYLASMYEPEIVKSVEHQLKKKGARPLMEGGSSWSNMYSGGADVSESHFVGSCLAMRDLMRSTSVLGLLIATVLYFPAVLRFIVLFMWEHIRCGWDLIDGLRRGEPLMKELGLIVSRVLIGTGLRELISIGAAIDLARGLPIIHLNYLSYDEWSHHRGPSSPSAHRSLRRLDRLIRQLYRRAHASARRDYQVWIFSDHGQEAVRAYVDEYKTTLGRVVLDGLKALQKTGVRGFRALPEGRERGAAWMRVAQIREHMQGHERADDAPEREQDAFAIAARGPVAHVYLAEKLGLEQRRLLARWLVTEGHVPGVLLSVGRGTALWVHPKGEVKLPEDGPAFLPHPAALRETLSHDLVTWCEHPNSGDLILLGWHPDEQPMTFPHERGSHGGPGREETQGFTLLPPNTRIPEEAAEFLRPATLRASALHALGREKLPARKGSATSVRRLRVMTYNVRSCMGMDGKVSPARIARVIRSFEPDIVALQEIDLGRARTRKDDQAKMIAEELEMHATFCCTVEKGEELYGHALLSRFPVEIVACGLFVTHPRAQLREPRGALLARVQLNGQEVYMLNTHFGLRDYERAAHIEDLLGPKWLGETPKDKPLVLCGDFNMMPRSRHYRALVQRGVQDVQLLLNGRRPANTFFAFLPFSRIDHIFVSPHFEVEEVRVPQTTLTRTASDHLPLIADLKLREN